MRKVGFSDYFTTQTEKIGSDDYSIFIVEVEIKSLKTKHWSRFKEVSIYVINNIACRVLIRYQDAKMKVIRGIYWD
jgi:hypothetical protein